MNSTEDWRYRIAAALQIVLLILIVSMMLSRHGTKPLFNKATNDGWRIEYRTIDSLDDIVPISVPDVPPITYTKVLSLTDLDVKLKKRKFFDLLLPSVLISKYKLAMLRQKITEFLAKKKLSTPEREWLDEQLVVFDADDYMQLLRKTKTHPVSIVLAQAALESGWGESRFFLLANNIFGTWSFNPQEPRMKAREDRQGKAIYMKKYRSLIESVDDYFLTIARGPYRGFRHARQQNDDPSLLVNHLTRYSEQGREYTRRLRKVIIKNNLRRYDSCRLDPAFIQRIL